MGKPSKYGVYSLKLKQLLLDNMTAAKNKSKENNKAESVVSETDSSTGLSSRLDKVKITGDTELEDIVNGNVEPADDDNGNNDTGIKTSKNNLKEKTIVVKDKNKTVEVSITFELNFIF